MQKTMQTMSRSYRGILRLTVQSVAISMLMAPLSTVQAQTTVALDLVSQGINQKGGFDDNLREGAKPWKNKRFEWYYNPARQPISMDRVLATAENAAAKWKSACNIDIVYKGTVSTDSSLVHKPGELDKRNVVGWDAFPQRSDCGNNANTEGCVSRSSDAAQSLEVDVSLNTNYWPRYLPGEIYRLDGAMTRMFGLMIGMDISSNPVSVLTNDANAYNNFHLARVLRGDDITRCVALYGSTPNTDTDRVFNFFEVIFLWGLNDRDWVGPLGTVTQTSGEWRYRTYPNHDTTIGEIYGQIYLLHRGLFNPYAMIGSIEQWMPTAELYKF